MNFKISSNNIIVHLTFNLLLFQGDIKPPNGHSGSVRSVEKKHVDDNQNAGIHNMGFVGLEEGAKGLAEGVAASHTYCNCAERAGEKKLMKLGE